MIIKIDNGSPFIFSYDLGKDHPMEEVYKMSERDVSSISLETDKDIQETYPRQKWILPDRYQYNDRRFENLLIVKDNYLRCSDTVKAAKIIHKNEGGFHLMMNSRCEVVKEIDNYNMSPEDIRFVTERVRNLTNRVLDDYAWLFGNDVVRVNTRVNTGRLNKKCFHPKHYDGDEVLEQINSSVRFPMWAFIYIAYLDGHCTTKLTLADQEVCSRHDRLIIFDPRIPHSIIGDATEGGRVVATGNLWDYVTDDIAYHV